MTKTQTRLDSFNTKELLDTRMGKVVSFSLVRLAKDHPNVAQLPFSIRVLLESMLRNEDGHQVSKEDIQKLLDYDPKNPAPTEIPFKPARVILQDFTGVPSVVDLAALRSAMARLGGDPQRINPQVPVDLVIDHSVQVDAFGSSSSLEENNEIEFSRNAERYEFLRWGQSAFDNFRVVPPASGIVHQVNLEYLARGVHWQKEGDELFAYPDSLVGTDSHTTMINGLGILGWGVGGIEAEAVMLGQPIYMLPPAVVGFELKGKLPEGATATDLALTITQMLRETNVVGQFVEFTGPGLSQLSLADRATVANMAPEYGATMGFFPVDEESLRYLRRTGRTVEQLDLIEKYCRAQGLFRTDESPTPQFARTVSLNLEEVQPSLAGPKRPQDRIALPAMKNRWRETLRAPISERGFALSDEALDQSGKSAGTQPLSLRHGDVVIAAITSCTNTSNPSVLLAAGLLAQKAIARGLTVDAHVKTSLAPGSRVVTDYLQKTELLKPLETLGFHVVGYGCTTCIGNSGPLPEPVVEAIDDGSLVVASVLSGNRNFEGRISPHIKANYLASPPLVVAYAIAGTVNIDLNSEPLGVDAQGNNVFLKDIWPSNEEIGALLDQALDPENFIKRYSDVESSNSRWNAVPLSGDAVYEWREESSYIQEPPFFVDMAADVAPIKAVKDARVLVKVGDSVTTDHISPAGAIAADGPAGRYLQERGVVQKDFNSYGSRRGNDRVMTRGTFANIRLRNQLAPGTEGGWTTDYTTGQQSSIFDAAANYQAAGIPTVVLAGKDYGMGSSRDWAAKGTYLLGVAAVIAESFERIHRSNLVGMGVLPLQLNEGDTWKSLGLEGTETLQIAIDDSLKPRQQVDVVARSKNGKEVKFQTVCRIDTPIEVDYYRNGGILHTVLRQMLAQ